MERTAAPGYRTRRARWVRDPRDIVDAARQVGAQLLRSRILLAYVVLGVLSGLRFGPQGLGIALVNYLVLLPAYVLLIRLWTGNESTVVQLVAQTDRNVDQGKARLRRDLFLVAALLAVNLGTLIWFWVGGFPLVVMGSVQASLGAAGWDRALANGVANAVESTLFNLLPSLVLVFLLFHLRPHQVGLRPRYLGLGLALIAFGIGAAYVIRLALGSSTDLFDPKKALPLVLTLYLAQLFINALQEEIVFRGVIFTRLLSWLANPLHALVLMVLLFNALHIPSYVFHGGASVWDWLGIAYQPTGLVWGYLFYRTRSIWPGVFWHASYGVLGVLFLG